MLSNVASKLKCNLLLQYMYTNYLLGVKNVCQYSIYIVDTRDGFRVSQIKCILPLTQTLYNEPKSEVLFSVRMYASYENLEYIPVVRCMFMFMLSVQHFGNFMTTGNNFVQFVGMMYITAKMEEYLVSGLQPLAEHSFIFGIYNFMFNQSTRLHLLGFM